MDMSDDSMLHSLNEYAFKVGLMHGGSMSFSSGSNLDLDENVNRSVDVQSYYGDIHTTGSSLDSLSFRDEYDGQYEDISDMRPSKKLNELPDLTAILARDLKQPYVLQCQPSFYDISSSFVTKADPTDVIQSITDFLDKNKIVYNVHDNKAKIRILIIDGSNNPIHVQISLFRSAEDDESYLVEVQRRMGCVVSFFNFFDVLVDTIKNIIHTIHSPIHQKNQEDPLSIPTIQRHVSAASAAVAASSTSNYTPIMTTTSCAEYGIISDSGVDALFSTTTTTTVAEMEFDPLAMPSLTIPSLHRYDITVEDVEEDDDQPGDHAFDEEDDDEDDDLVLGSLPPPSLVRGSSSVSSVSSMMLDEGTTQALLCMCDSGDGILACDAVRLLSNSTVDNTDNQRHVANMMFSTYSPSSSSSSSTSTSSNNGHKVKNFLMESIKDIYSDLCRCSASLICNLSSLSDARPLLLQQFLPSVLELLDSATQSCTSSSSSSSSLSCMSSLYLQSVRRTAAHTLYQWSSSNAQEMLLCMYDMAMKRQQRSDVSIDCYLSVLLRCQECTDPDVVADITSTLNNIYAAAS